MSTNEKSSKASLPAQVRLGFFIALPLLVIINAAVWIHYVSNVESQRRQWLSQADMAMDSALISIERWRNDLSGDLRLLSNSPNLKSTLDEPSENHLLALAAEWERFMVTKRWFDQIRWLDVSGMERLRVNLTPNGATRANDSALQDKSQRYYFQEAMTLQSGQLYVSPIDLNVESGEIERPHKPMLRLAVPISDTHGEKRGLLLANVLANFILDELGRDIRLSANRMLLLDQRGYYVHGFKADQAWGFMSDTATDPAHRFDKAYPEVWQRIARNQSGRFESDQGLFVYRTTRYGSDGFGQFYILLGALLPEDMAALTAEQRMWCFSISALSSLLLIFSALLTAHYRTLVFVAENPEESATRPHPPVDHNGGSVDS
ncbi:MAG: cache domain-containing protein [Candidatus Thiodiazotropha sp. (ex Monitilora ramsayi)]|nr:cache domain-containing protein [Candidatus Thiodiazotropha sp. (ex Monitilora ramsayi)]